MKTTKNNNMHLSTNELFHFTNYKNLNLIIQTKAFIPKFNLEYTFLSDSFQRKAILLPIPMVCFCDIPYEQSDNHRNRYGHCGIVLKEKWKLNKGLNPVFYVQKDSFIANSFSFLFSMIDDYKQIIRNKNNSTETQLTVAKTGHNLTYISFFIKQFENKKVQKVYYEFSEENCYEERKFYDEREWRYVPFEADNKNELIISPEIFQDKQRLQLEQDKISKYKLTFEQDDIEYLIVENKEQAIELEKVINRIFSKEIEIRIN